MPLNASEKTFESAIEENLLAAGGYAKGDARGYDRARGLFPAEALAFVAATQPGPWAAVGRVLGASRDAAFLDAVTRMLDARGALEVLRFGVSLAGKTFRLAYFRPATRLNPDLDAKVGQNRVTITRQVFYSPANKNSVDLVGAVNGIPVYTAELKNPYTGQTVEDAKRQYREDRDPREKLFAFKQRCLVHFAVDPDRVEMTTQLAGPKTRFLPFNKGRGMGAGNPDNPGGVRTAYLWEEVLERESLLDLLHRFVQTEKPKRRFAKKGETGTGDERLVFPRYHQLRAVRRLVAASRGAGAGVNYLVQHSAGSGKTNTISWLAHQLHSLHDAGDRKVFDSVIVVTDRVVLNQQLQDAIYEMEHKKGVVAKVESGSRQLTAELKARTPIIITTIQTFPFVLEHLEGGLPDGRYAVIVDEAHSSQSGEASMQMKRVLGGKRIAAKARQQLEEEGGDDATEAALKAAIARGKQDNLAFFAFTATPKHKTLEVFGTKSPADGKPVAFDLYPMRQAIEEGFILDVLANYTTYRAYYKLAQRGGDDREVEKRAAAKALARFAALHPYNISQKVEVIVEHFRTFTRHKIGGRAKAMVVTTSREAAVRYKQAFDAYIADRKYTDVRSLVAFSGDVRLSDDPTGTTFTEVGMNGGIREKELPEKFAGDEYQVLLVAEKYQTGFDEPLLHTMYVDRRLDGVQAVQTLSRLNRMHDGKDDTFVLDFVNDVETIREAFQPYYETTDIRAEADPQLLYVLQAKLASAGVYTPDDVAVFAETYFPEAEAGGGQPGTAALKRLYALQDPLEAHFRELPEEERTQFRTDLGGFLNLYAFLAQVTPYQDAGLESLYMFGKHLATRLRDGRGPRVELADAVALQYYALRKTSEGGVALEPGGPGYVAGPAAVGSGEVRRDTVRLSELLTSLNGRFGTNFTEADQVFFESLVAEAVESPELQTAAQSNTLDNFAYAYERAERDLILDRFTKDEDLVTRLLNDEEFRRVVSPFLMRQVYEGIRGRAATGSLPSGRPSPAALDIR